TWNRSARSFALIVVLVSSAGLDVTHVRGSTDRVASVLHPVLRRVLRRYCTGLPSGGSVLLYLLEVHAVLEPDLSLVGCGLFPIPALAGTGAAGLSAALAAPLQLERVSLDADSSHDAPSCVAAVVVVVGADSHM